MMGVRKAVFWALSLTVALALAGCTQKPAGRQTPGATVQASVTQIVAQSLTDYADLPGTVVAAQQVQLGSRLMGYIHGLEVREGESVKAGQVLFQVDPTDVQGQIAQAQAGLAEAQAALADARANYERFKVLYAEQAIPRQQWEQVQMQYEMAKARVAAARAGAGVAGAQLRYARVRAPFAGIITQKFMQDGDLAAPGRPVLTLENPARLEVRFTASDAVFAKLHMGEAIAVQSDGKRVNGTVVDLVAAADPVTHSHLVKLGLPADSGLSSGAFVTVRVPVGTHQGFVIPSQALLHRAGIPGVFVVGKGGLAEYRMVRVGATTPQGVEILAGLAAGETVVTGNADKLNNGDRVQATEDGQ